MSTREVVIEGTLKADGTLELDQRPTLAPGRVRVLVQPIEVAPEAVPTENLWAFMQRTRHELERAGSHFMNEKEVQAHIDWLREPDQIDEMLQHMPEERPSQGHS